MEISVVGTERFLGDRCLLISQLLSVTPNRVLMQLNVQINVFRRGNGDIISRQRVFHPVPIQLSENSNVFFRVFPEFNAYRVTCVYCNGGLQNGLDTMMLAAHQAVKI